MKNFKNSISINENIIKILNPESFQYKIIDFHSHFNGNPKIHLNYLIKFNIKAICIMPSFKILEFVDFGKFYYNDFNKPEDYLERLKKLKAIFHENNSIGWKGNIFIFLPIIFNKKVTEFEELIINFKPAGLKLHPLQNFKIDKKILDPWFNLAKKYDLIVYIHTDWVPSTEWKKNKNLMAETFGKIAELYPNVKIIMGHAGSNDSYLNVWKYVKKYKNVFVETSLSPTPQELEKVVYKADETRLLFGSDYPFSKIEGEIMKIYKMRRISQEQKEAIFYDNALKLLKSQPYIEI